MQLVRTPISHDQRKKIYALAKDLNLSNDQLHDLMPAWAGTASLGKDNCTSAQANKIIEALGKMNNSSSASASKQSHHITGNIGKPGFITQKQFLAINQICAAKKWSPEHLNNFIKHTTGTLTADELTMKEASQVITGLKKL